MISTISTTWFCNTSFKLQKTLHITTWSWTTKFSLQSNSTIRISEGKILRFLCLFHVCFKSWYKTVMGKVDFHKAKSFPITYTEWVWSLASLKKQIHKYLNYNQKLLRNILLHKVKFHLFFHLIVSEVRLLIYWKLKMQLTMSMVVSAPLQKSQSFLTPPSPSRRLRCYYLFL